jgi:hypothetical protein
LTLDANQDIFQIKSNLLFEINRLTKNVNHFLRIEIWGSHKFDLNLIVFKLLFINIFVEVVKQFVINKKINQNEKNLLNHIQLSNKKKTNYAKNKKYLK